MQILLSFAAGVLLTLDLSPNVFALTVRDDGGGAQAVLAESNSSIAPPDRGWEEVDVSEGWADPRINGGRLLDVSRLSVMRCTHERNPMLMRQLHLLRSSQRRSSASRST
jgi:hypothetical protein